MHPLLKYSWLLNAVRDQIRLFANEVSVPSIIFGEARGSFEITLNHKKSHLARSNALHLAATSAKIGKCFTLQRVFREEPECTKYHLSEFNLLECALPGTTLLESEIIVERLIKNIHAKAIETFGQEQIAILKDTSFQHVDWIDAVNANRKLSNVDFSQSPGMDKIADISHPESCIDPFFLENLPQGQVSWTLCDTADGRKLSFNLIFPNAGEVSEGGVRFQNKELLNKKFEAAGCIKQLSWYAEAISTIPPPLTIFAIGMERLAMWLFKANDVSDMALFYRKSFFSEIESFK